MICATLTTGGGGVNSSLRQLIELATPGQVPSTHTGRVSRIHLQWVAGNVNVSWRGGVTDFPENAHRLQADRRELILEAPNNNQLSLDMIFLGAAGTIRIIAVCS